MRVGDVEAIAEREQLVVATKLDIDTVRERTVELERRLEERGHRMHALSSATGEGCDELVAELATRVAATRAEDADATRDAFDDEPETVAAVDADGARD